METRVIEFGYSSNLGGVEVFIKNIIMNTSIPIDLVATTQDKIPFEDDFVTKGSRIFRIPSRRSAPSEYKRNIENVLRDHPEIKAAHVHLNSCSSIEALEAAKKVGMQCIAHSHNSNSNFNKLTKTLHTINKKRLNIYYCKTLSLYKIFFTYLQHINSLFYFSFHICTNI